MMNNDIVMTIILLIVTIYCGYKWIQGEKLLAEYVREIKKMESNKDE